MYVLRAISAIIFCSTLLYASVLDNEIEKDNDVSPDVSQNGFYNIKERTIKHIPSRGRKQEHAGIDVLKDDIHWIKNGTYKVIDMIEEGYEKVAENGDVVWKKGKEVVLQIPEDFYNYLVKDHILSGTLSNVSKDFQHDGCSCLNNTCMCCIRLMDAIHVSDQICVGYQIEPDILGLRVFLIIDNTTYSEEVSVKNPPPLCIINIYKELKICVKVYDIDTSFKTLHGCLEVGFQTYRIPLVYVKLGCITAFDGLPASIDYCLAHISSSSVVLTCVEKPGQKADFFILYFRRDNSIVDKTIAAEPHFNILTLQAETVYNVSVTPAVIKGNGSSFAFSLNTSTVDGEDFDRIFVNNAASSVAIQVPITILMVYVLYSFL